MTESELIELDAAMLAGVRGGFGRVSEGLRKGF